MSRKRKRRSLAPFFFCAVVLILSAAFCVGYVSFQERISPHLQQSDVTEAYNRGYLAGYHDAMAYAPTQKPSPTPTSVVSSPTQYPELTNAPSFGSSLLLGLYDAFVDFAQPTPEPSGFSRYVQERARKEAENAGSFNEYVLKKQAGLSSSSSEPTYEYIGNRNSMIFHDPDCASVDQMKESNKVFLSSRSEAIDAGYRPCQRCYP